MPNKSLDGCLMLTSPGYYSFRASQRLFNYLDNQYYHKSQPLGLRTAASDTRQLFSYGLKSKCRTKA